MKKINKFKIIKMFNCYINDITFFSYAKLKQMGDKLYMFVIFLNNKGVIVL